jgi:hypothetical protein
MHPLRGMVGDCAGPRWRVLIVNRLGAGGRPFEGLLGICSACQLFIAQRLEGLTTGTVRPSQLTTCVLATVLIASMGRTYMIIMRQHVIHLTREPFFFHTFISSLCKWQSEGHTKA